jgi:hypothetical protein
MIDKTQFPPTGSAFHATGFLSTLANEDAPSQSGSTVQPGTTLSPSLLLDLKRFAQDPIEADLLAVVAASVRHGKPLSLALELDEQPLDLTLHPQRQIYYGSRDICSLADEALARVKLLRVQPDADTKALLESRPHIGSLRPMLWHLALRGSQSKLLPEIAGPVRCRLALGISLNGLPINGMTKRLIARMKDAPVSVEDLLDGTLQGRAAVQRVWNALYLQSALMVSRAFPH